MPRSAARARSWNSRIARPWRWKRVLRRDYDARVTVAMRYWHPFTDAAIREMERHAPAELVLLPLYPQYSKTTTGSSLNEWNAPISIRTAGVRASTWSSEFYEDPAYIDSVVEAVDGRAGRIRRSGRRRFRFQRAQPSGVGDREGRSVPAADRADHRAGLAARRLAGRRHLCYQSKVGASKWLAPSMHETVKRLADEGRKNVLVVPISFVSDHVETLHEIDIEHREQARVAGNSELPDGPGTERFARVYRSARGSGSGADCGAGADSVRR